MRASLASSVAVACAAALALPVTLAVPATATARPAATGRPAGPSALPPGPDAVPSDRTEPSQDGAEPSPAGDEPPGSTRSLPLRPLGASVRTFGTDPGAAPEQGLTRRDVSPFSLVGVVWDDPATVLHGTVQVRTRAAADGVWSAWQDVETHNDEHGADPGTAEGASGTLRGSTAPLWVGDSDGVEIRVRAETTDTGTDRVRLPAGLRLELVDPGEAPADPAPGTRAMAPPAALTAAEAAASAANGQWAPAGAAVIPAETAETAAQAGTAAAAPAAAKKPYIGPRPRIITRKGWGADERLREKGFVYTKTIKAAFVHHTATGNNYRCAQAPSVLRGIYRYHVKSSGWRDFGYNFAVDRCGNIYEGRAGGVAKPVLGAHTLGFNTNSMGIAVLGSFGGSTPPAAAVTAVARLTAWKLGLHGVNPKGTQTLVSGGGNRYKKGRKVAFHAIAGHRDGFATECPGSRLYGKLGTARASSAKYQGRR
ncbi:peptidoglycan recognition protein family protein [Streptomyces filamentosus]|uniref:peptidoglycan recognition protein family protein n=1 Tax=Streptomyces filamentosus TaxID=67294 RepID=UPI00341177F3